MPKMKAGTSTVGAEATGFDTYEGPEPKPGVYNAVIKQIRMKESKAGNLYYNILFEWEGNEGEKAQYNGYTLFHMLVPGDHELQQVRENQLLKAVAGKFPADVVFAELDSEERGKVTKIGTRKPDGTTVKVAVGREPDNRTPGEFRLRVNDIFPRSKPTEDIEEEESDVAVDDGGEVVEVEEVEEEVVEEEELDADGLREELSKLKLPALKKVAKEDYEFSADALKGYRSVEGLVEAIVEAAFPPEEAEEEEAEEGEESIDFDELREELAGLKLPALKKRARSEYGMSAADIAAQDGPAGIIDAIIELLGGGSAGHEFSRDDNGLITYGSAMEADRGQLLELLKAADYDPDDFDEYTIEEMVDTLVDEGVVAEDAEGEPPF